jgi:5-methylcytosine-specific restriction protein A
MPKLRQRRTGDHKDMPRYERSVFCAEPGCTVTLDQPGRCDQHGRTNWDRWRRTDEGRRRASGYGSKWRTIRNAYLRQHPACERCGAPATEVHHRDHRTAAEPGANDWRNLEAVCRRCHVIASADAWRSSNRVGTSQDDAGRFANPVSKATPRTPATPRERRPRFVSACRPMD